MTLKNNSYSPAACLLGPGLTSFERLTDQISPPATPPQGASFGDPDDKELGLEPLFWTPLTCAMAWTYIQGPNFIFSDQGEERNGLLASWGCQ